MLHWIFINLRFHFFFIASLLQLGEGAMRREEKVLRVSSPYLFVLFYVTFFLKTTLTMGPDLMIKVT
jgi:hypothetical protein